MDARSDVRSWQRAARAAATGLVLAGLGVGALPATAAARGARLDPAFGGGRGWVTTRIHGMNGVAYGAAATAGGKIVIAGQATTRSGNGQIVVARYLPSGRLDTEFASRGIFTTALPSKLGPFLATAVVAERATGRLLVAGGYGQGSMLVLRLTPAGRLDSAFGRHGLAVTPAGGIAQSLAIQRDGKLLVGGSNANRNGRPMAVARLTRTGTLDRRFGRGGIAQPLFWNPDLAASAGVASLAQAADGSVIGAGHLDYIGSDGHGSAGIFRLSATGQPVAGFGTAGHAEVAFTQPGGAFAQWFPCAMGVDRRGRITVTGDGSVGAAPALLTTRLTAGGRLDSSFGTGGRAVTPGLRGGSDTTCGAALGPAGTLTAGVGVSLAQLLPGGTANGAFAPGGVLRIAAPRGVGINAVVLPGGRRAVVAGFAGSSLYVARYLLPAQP